MIRRGWRRFAPRCCIAVRQGAEWRTDHVTELRLRAAAAEAKLKCLYGAIEVGVIDLADPMSRDCIAEMTTVRDHACADAGRSEASVERLGTSVTPCKLTTFATEACKRMCTEAGGYRRDHLRASGQRVELGKREVRIIGSKTELLRILTAVEDGESPGSAFAVVYRTGVHE